MESIFRFFKQDAVDEGIIIGEKLGIEKGEKLGIEKGEKLGIEKGRAEGKTEGRAEDVIRLLANGFEAHNISMLLNIPVKDVEDIIKDKQEEIARIAEEIKSENSK